MSSSNTTTTRTTARTTARTTHHNKKPNQIRASVCDSRSCHQMGGGQHMKADLEDLMGLVSNTETVGRVQVTTCLGLCNRAPNVLLQSRGDVLLYPLQRQRLVNDGGFRMRVDDATQDDRANETNANQSKTSHKVIVSEMTIRKVAKVLGLVSDTDDQQHPQHILRTRINIACAVRSIEAKAAGNQRRKAGHYAAALRHYDRGWSELNKNNNETTTNDDTDTDTDPRVTQSIASLAASLWLCHVQCRVQWATTSISVPIITPTTNNTKPTKEQQQPPQQLLSHSEARQALHLAATDAVLILARNYDHHKEETSSATIHGVIGALLQSDEAINNCRDDDKEETVAVPPPPPPITDDVTILAHLCVAVADAWRVLADILDDDDNSDNTAGSNIPPAATIRTFRLRQGVVVVYAAILQAATPETKFFRVREHRRITQRARSGGCTGYCSGVSRPW